MVRPCDKPANSYNVCHYWSSALVCSNWNSEKTVCKFFDNPSTISCLIEGKVSNFISYNHECGSALVGLDGKEVSVHVDMPYPFCNLVGTDDTCSKYNMTVSGTAVSGTGGHLCCLPDPKYGSCNHVTGDSWVLPKSSPTYDGTTGLLTAPIEWSFENITEYNNGACDGSGKSRKCSAYSPYHLAFGRLEPDKPTASGVFANTDKYCVLASEIDLSQFDFLLLIQHT